MGSGLIALLVCYVIYLLLVRVCCLPVDLRLALMWLWFVGFGWNECF